MGTAEVGDDRSERQLAEHMSSMSAPALSASPTVTYYCCLSLFQDCMESFRGGALQMRSSNFMPRPSTFLSWADGRVGFPSALMRVVALMAFFCSIHSFLCNSGHRMERLDRHLTSEGCNTFYMAKTSQCAPYYKSTITCILLL